MNIDPIRDLGEALLEVQKPARYLGGEYGATRKTGDGLLTVALCFPDLYEIGSSNNALRILYAELNALPGVRCERVFAPAPDFEALLYRKGLPLYTLESGLPLSDCDLLAFTIGYELSITNLLTVIASGGIALRATERGEEAPIILAGGPASTNPAPLSPFVDAIWIGEAEAGFFELAGELAALKRAGKGRAALLERIRTERAIWSPGKRAFRAIDAGFPSRRFDTALPLPTLKAVQGHGVVEIMRGCPNGCRFCHAGYFYRPQRVRECQAIFDDVERLVASGGHREITVSSLSSGDYPRIDLLLKALNARYADRHVSFQLPSLRVDSFSLPVIEEITQTRKSGLTFAVETPTEHWQRSINKTVTFDRIVAILREAKARGYRLAKFYFMLGLPLPGGEGEGEASALVDYLGRLLAATPLQLNINLGTFVPKPHTPYQWSRALNESEARAGIGLVREAFRREKRLKISWHDPFLSALEGVFARGDERAGEFALAAWKKGCRLDAWEEHFRAELWKEAAFELLSKGYDVWAEAARARGFDEALPWDEVSLRVSKPWLRRELERSEASFLSAACIDTCAAPCGSCGDADRAVINTIQADFLEAVIAEHSPEKGADRASLAPIGQRRQAVNPGKVAFTWTRGAKAAFWPHHQFHDAFHRAFLIAGLPVAYTEGFNPLARLELSDPLPIGVRSAEELAMVVCSETIAPDDFLRRLGAVLPEGLSLGGAVWLPIVELRKQHSIASLYWGSDWRLELGADTLEVGRAALAAELASHDELSGWALQAEPGALRFRLPAGGRKELGLQAVLNRALGEDPGRALRLERLAQYARGEVGPAPYLETMQALA